MTTKCSGCSLIMRKIGQENLWLFFVSFFPARFERFDLKKPTTQKPFNIWTVFLKCLKLKFISWAFFEPFVFQISCLKPFKIGQLKEYALKLKNKKTLKNCSNRAFWRKILSVKGLKKRSNRSYLPALIFESNSYKFAQILIWTGRFDIGIFWHWNSLSIFACTTAMLTYNSKKKLEFVFLMGS